MKEHEIQRVALPFTLRRGHDAFTASTVTTTLETVHGLLVLEGDRLVVQWRRSVKTDHVGAATIHSDEEVGAVRERVVPLAAVAGAEVRRRRWAPWISPVLVLRAADLAAFDEIAGAEGLRLDHPAELILGLRRRDVLLAEEFSADLTLALALAARVLGSGAERPTLPRPKP